MLRTDFGDSSSTMLMSGSAEKAIKTLFKGHDQKQKEFTEELSDLRIEKDGGLVFKDTEGAPKIVVTFVGSK